VTNTPFQDIAIVAGYNSQQAKHLEGQDDLSLLTDVIQNLLSQSQLTADDIDGININSAVWNLKPREALSMLGGQERWCGNEFMGIAAVIEAAGAIATGQADTIMIACAQAGEYSHTGATAPWTRPSHEFSECFGLYTAAEFALCAQRHMAIYGTQASALAEVAATIRCNGHYHPQAQFYGKGLVTPEQVLASRMVCSPFHLLDCCITSEGAGGLIITTAERARDMDAKAVFIVGAGTDRQGMSYTRAPVWDQCGDVGQRAARRAFEQAGLKPTDIDVCEFYDPFSFEIIRQFEAFGFCKPGEGGDFIANGRIAIDGEFPVATNGGLLSFSHAGTLQMLQKVIVAYEQLSGKMPTSLQVKNPTTAMATNGGSGALFCDVMLLANQATANK
tara:strand:+ start:207 stop:1376 length:1170 start_codon:yes stop_codon:yes gene_type:complete